MDLAIKRRERGVTLEQLAEAVGLSPASAGHLSRIENGRESNRYATFEVALKIERFFNGEVRAIELLSPADRDLLAHHDVLFTAQPAEVAA